MVVVGIGRIHACARPWPTLLRGRSILFPVNARGARPDKGLAVGRARTICVHTRDSIGSVAHPGHEVSLPVAPLQDASSFGLVFPGWLAGPRADKLSDASTRDVAGGRRTALSTMGSSQVGQSTGFIPYAPPIVTKSMASIMSLYWASLSAVDPHPPEGPPAWIGGAAQRDATDADLG
jgi:hypothetical protein